MSPLPLPSPLADVPETKVGKFVELMFFDARVVEVRVIKQEDGNFTLIPSTS